MTTGAVKTRRTREYVCSIIVTPRETIYVSPHTDVELRAAAGDYWRRIDRRTRGGHLVWQFLADLAAIVEYEYQHGRSVKIV